MPNSIREILEELFIDERVKGFIIDEYYYKELKNYITNLQEENKRLHTRIKTIKRRRKAQTAKMRKYREEITNKQNSIVDYKSKIDELEKNINEEINKFKGIVEAQGILIDKDLYERCDNKIGSLMFVLDKLKALKEGK